MNGVVFYDARKTTSAVNYTISLVIATALSGVAVTVA